MNRTLYYSAIVLLALAGGAGCNGTPDAEDPDEKPPEGCKYKTGNGTFSFQEKPIPAGFFDSNGRHCEPFAGSIHYSGQAIDKSAHDQVDTVVHRYGDPVDVSDPIGTEGSVGIDIVAMSIASTEPMFVWCDGEPTAWNVDIDLSQTAPSKGTLTAVKEHGNGGTAGITLMVYPRFQFMCVDDPTVVRVLDMAAEGLDPIRLRATIPWAHGFDLADPGEKGSFLIGLDGRSDSHNADRPERDTLECLHFHDQVGDHVHDACWHRVPD